MKKIMCLLVCFLSLSLSAATQASNVKTVVVGEEDHFQQLSLRPYILHYVGSASISDASQASEISSNAYSTLTSASPLLPMSVQWFRFSIHNDSNIKRAFVFNLDQSLFSKINFQTTMDGVAVKTVLTGQDYPYTSRDLKYDFYAFQLEVPAGKTLQVDFSLATRFSALFIPVLVDADLFPQQAAMTGRFTGTITGIIYSVVLFLLIYMLRTHRMGLEFQMWAFAVMNFMSVLYIAGVIQRVIPDAYLAWRNISFLFIHGLQGFFFTQVLRGYCHTRIKFPVLDKSLWVVGILLLACVLLSLLKPDAYLYMALMSLNSVALVVAVVLALLTLYFSWAEYWLFSIGLLLFVGLMFSSSLPAFTLLPNSQLAHHGYEVGLTLQVTFLFIIIASRIFTEEKAKLAVQEQMVKVNAEMEAHSEFVDRVTHDIKSPLSAVVGAVQLMREPVASSKHESYLDVIQHSSSIVIGIVDSILSYSRMKSGHMTLQIQSVSIRSFLTEIENALRIAHRQKNLDFFVMVADDVSPQVMGDTGRLYQLLNNLLTNAFKFTDHGSVSLEVNVVKKELHHVVLRFVVRDTGIGISPEYLEKIFEPYARDESYTGYRPGFGLGLPICKQIVEFMQGTIEVSSRLGVGSCFTVTLPFDLP